MLKESLQHPSKNNIRNVLFDQQSFRLKDSDVLRKPIIEDHREVIVISGVRRCGKSTLLQVIRLIKPVWKWMMIK